MYESNNDCRGYSDSFELEYWLWTQDDRPKGNSGITFIVDAETQLRDGSLDLISSQLAVPGLFLIYPEVEWAN